MKGKNLPETIEGQAGVKVWKRKVWFNVVEEQEQGLKVKANVVIRLVTMKCLDLVGSCSLTLR